MDVYGGKMQTIPIWQWLPSARLEGPKNAEDLLGRNNRRNYYNRLREYD
jgi:hypothetical protein